MHHGENLECPIHAVSHPVLTQPELKQLLSVITFKRDKALFLLAYRHGLPWCLASLFEAFLLLRFTAVPPAFQSTKLPPNKPRHGFLDAGAELTRLYPVCVAARTN
jgi:hypothetical protein